MSTYGYGDGGIGADERYWALETGDKLSEKLRFQIHRYFEACDSSGRSELWRRSTKLYYGLDATGGWNNSSAVTYGGEQGELVLLRVNHYRSLIQSVHTLVTGSRPALQARAGSDDYETMERTLFAQSLLEFYFKKRRIEDTLRKAANYSLYLGEGWVYLGWDTTRGRLFDADPDTGRRYYEGDAISIPLRPIDVIRDPGREGIGDEDHDWVIVRRQLSRWDLIEQFPDFEDHLRQLKGSEEYGIGASNYRGYQHVQTNDYLDVFEFHHKRTYAAPNGRYALMVGDKVLVSGDLPYKELPVFPMFPDQEEGTPFGYSPIFDLMAPQEAYDSVISTIVSAHDATGVPNVWTRKGDQLNVKDLSGALRHIQSDEPPQVVQITSISQHSYQIEQLMNSIMERLSGINSVVRGDPAGNLKSGASMALVHSQAIQYNSGIHGAYARLAERVGTGLLEMLQLNVKTERVAEIAGEHTAAVSRTWSGDDLEGVSRVVVELANPLLQTSQGRKQLADEWAERGWLKGPEQYAQVLTSGRAEPIYRKDRDELRLVEAENERLRKGDSRIQAMVTDHHLIHIREHTCVLSDPDIRFNEEIAGPALAHIQQHIDLLQNTNPVVLQAVGIDPQMIQALLPPPPMEPVPGPVDPGAPGPEIPAEQAMAEVGAGTQAELPNFPINPATGERFDPNQ